MRARARADREVADPSAFGCRGEIAVGNAHGRAPSERHEALLAGPGHAHQLANTGKATLRYLCMSTMHAPEVALYPDAGKLAVLGGPDIPIREMYFRKDALQGPGAYFEGEPKE